MPGRPGPTGAQGSQSLVYPLSGLIRVNGVRVWLGTSPYHLYQLGIQGPLNQGKGLLNTKTP